MDEFMLYVFLHSQVFGNSLFGALLLLLLRLIKQQATERSVVTGRIVCRIPVEYRAPLFTGRGMVDSPIQLA
jgi:hypothetical protein